MPKLLFQKGNIPWNKGLKGYNTGRPSPMKGKHHTKEAKEKNRLAHLGKVAPMKGRPNLKIRGANHPQWKGGVSPLMEKIRKSIEYKQWRHQVYVRDSFTCVECQKVGRRLNAHHLKKFSKIIEEYNIKTSEDALRCPELWDIDNGVTLCEDCHKLTDNYGRRKNEITNN